MILEIFSKLSDSRTGDSKPTLNTSCSIKTTTTTAYSLELLISSEYGTTPQQNTILQTCASTQILFHLRQRHPSFIFEVKYKLSPCVADACFCPICSKRGKNKNKNHSCEVLAAQRGCGCPVHPWRCSRPGWMGP